MIWSFSSISKSNVEFHVIEMYQFECNEESVKVASRQLNTYFLITVITYKKIVDHLLY